MSDDVGSNARRESVWIAVDPDGFEWWVAPHDADPTWNYMRCAPDGDVWDLETDFASADEAKAAATRAAEVLFGAAA